MEGKFFLASAFDTECSFNVKYMLNHSFLPHLPIENLPFTLVFVTYIQSALFLYFPRYFCIRISVKGRFGFFKLFKNSCVELSASPVVFSFFYQSRYALMVRCYVDRKRKPSFISGGQRRNNAHLYIYFFNANQTQWFDPKII